VDATRLKAVDLLNQMEGVYINKIESKTAQLVELVIVTADPALKDGVVEDEAESERLEKSPRPCLLLRRN